MNQVASGGGRSRGFRRSFFAVMLFVLAVSPFVNSLRGPWLLDDHPLIAQNPFVRRPTLWPSLWTSDYWSITGAPSGLYRPLTMMTYAVTWALAGNSTVPFHATNVLLHGIITVLVWRLGMGGSTRAAAGLAALLFAWHPVHAEAVANIVGRAELLVAFFFLAALAAHRRARGRPGWLFLEGAAAFAMLLCKESALPMLAYFFVEDVARGRWRRGAQPGFPPVGSYLVLGASLLLYLLLRGNASLALPALARDYTGWERLHLSTSAAWKNVAMLLGLSEHRAVWNVPELPLGKGSLAAGLLVIAGLAAGLGLAARAPTPARLGTALLGLGFLPLLHLLPNVIWVWERGLYLPSIGLSWIVFGVGRRAHGRWRGCLLGVASLLVLTAAWRVSKWSELYADARRFWAHEYHSDPESVNAALSYSEALLRSSDSVPDGVRIRQETVARHPRSGSAYSALVSAYAATGRVTEARDVLTSAGSVPLSFPSEPQRRQGLQILARQAQSLNLPELAEQFRRAARERRHSAAPDS